MITRAEIRKLSNAASYKKGLEIFQSDIKIRDFAIGEGQRMDTVKAEVKGSGKNVYQVNLLYDREFDQVDEITCSCPAFDSYSVHGICKHCVAVLLEYADYKSRKAALEKYIKERNQQNLLKQGAAKKQSETFFLGRPREPQTTEAIKDLLHRQSIRKTAALTQKSALEQVQLEPCLNMESTAHGMKSFVEFKIGNAHKYVLKDVFEFARHMQEGDSFTYGKKLSFMHLIEAFTPESRKLVRFLTGWVRDNQHKYAQNYYYGYRYTSSMPKMRQVPLSADMLSEFLDIMEDRPFRAFIPPWGEQEWKMAVDKALPRTLTITGREKGIQVEINQMSGYRIGSYYLYFLDGEIYRIPEEQVEEISDFLMCMAELPDRSFYVQQSDVPAFCRNLLPQLEKHFLCTREAFEESNYGVIPVSFEIYLDMPQDDLVTGRVMAVYGEKKYNVFDRKFPEGRDMAVEIETGDIIASYFSAFDEQKKEWVLADDEERLYVFLAEGIGRFQELGEVFVSDALKKLRITQAPKVTVGISLSQGMLELQLTAGDMSKTALLEILSKYNKKKKYYRLKNGEFINIESDGMDALLEMRQGLHLTDKQLKQEEILLPKYRALYLNAELKDHPSLQAVKDKEFRALIRNMKTVEDNDFELPKDLETVLRAYQKQGFLWIKTLQANGFGGILADDMGLGKTLQVIAFLWSEYLESEEGENKRTLIAAPSSLVFNWGNEIEKFAPKLPYRLITGTATERRQQISEAGEREVLVTSYDLLKRDIEQYEQMEFACQIIDEAQYIKNHGTLAARSVKLISAGFKLALTGTPVENRMSELWSIFDYLMPRFLYSYERFRKEMEIPVVQNQDEQVMKRLQRMIQPFVLRRLKKDVLKDLPEKMERSYFAKLEGEQQKLYDAHVKRLQLLLDKQTDEEFKTSKIQLLAELTKLRQLCCYPGLLYEDYKDNSGKTEVCMELIQNAVNGGHKILLFSQFTTMLVELEKHLEELGISYYALTGSTSKEKRNELVKAFNENDVSVFCISLKAGGTGLNLTAADIVIHYDPWWNLAVQNQATDRAHRIGQKNAVTVYKLIMKDTIEENIMKLQEKKRELADQLLGGEGMERASFSREELLEVLR